MQFRDGPWPEPTQAYFWPAVNKRLTRLWPGYFLTQPKEILFDPNGKKLKNLGFFGEIFQTLTTLVRIRHPNSNPGFCFDGFGGWNFLADSRYWIRATVIETQLVQWPLIRWFCGECNRVQDCRCTDELKTYLDHIHYIHRLLRLPAYAARKICTVVILGLSTAEYLQLRWGQLLVNHYVNLK